MLVVGESLVDIVQTASGHLHEYAGGSAANVAVALARLGRPTRLASSFAADHHGAHGRRPPRAGRRHAGLRPGRRRPHLDGAGHDRDGGSGGLHLRHRLAAVAGAGRRGPARGARLLARGRCCCPAPTTCSRCSRRLRDRSTVSYDVNARPVVTGTGPEVVGAGRADGRGRRPGQGQRRGPRGPLPAPAARRVGGRAARARTGGRRGHPRRRRRAVAGPRGRRWRSPRGRWRWPTRSVPATPSGRASSMRSGSADGSGPRVAPRWPRCRAPRSPRCSSTPRGPRRSRSPDPGADPPYRHEL